MAMQPVLSWLVFASFLGAAYCIYFGVPSQLKNVIPNTTKSNSFPDIKTLSKRDSRASRKSLVPTVAKDLQRNVDQAIKTVKADVVTPTLPQPEKSPVQSGRHTSNTVKIEAWYNKNGTNVNMTGDSDDPVAAVMNGRPRKTSTPIGRQSFGEKSRNLHRTDTEEDGESKVEGPAHLAEAQWQQSRRTHVTDDMLDRGSSYVARTLKIVGTSSAEPIRQARRSNDAALTKKQRQNAAKKAKARAEKAEVTAQQAAALHAHQKEVERRRIVEISERDKRQQQSSKLSTASAWHDDDWTTVSKSKNKISNGQIASVDQNGKLIWE